MTKKSRIVALKNRSGAQIDPMKVQKMSLFVSEKFDDEMVAQATNVNFVHAANFDFDINSEGLVGNVVSPSEDTHLDDALKNFIRNKELKAIDAVIKEMAVLFDSVKPGTEPSLTEYIEVCLKDKLAICLMEEDGDDGYLITKPLGNTTRLVPNSVESYYTAC